jgi:hypothetical protein
MPLISTDEFGNRTVMMSISEQADGTLIVRLLQEGHLLSFRGMDYEANKKLANAFTEALAIIGKALST